MACGFIRRLPASSIRIPNADYSLNLLWSHQVGMKRLLILGDDVGPEGVSGMRGSASQNRKSRAWNNQGHRTTAGQSHFGLIPGENCASIPSAIRIPITAMLSPAILDKGRLQIAS
jgi:hypothetical protein